LDGIFHRIFQKGLGKEGLNFNWEELGQGCPINFSLRLLGLFHLALVSGILGQNFFAGTFSKGWQIFKAQEGTSFKRV